MSLALWRTIYRGAPASLDAACRPAVEAGARTIAAIVAKGEPVYGINTGFGKLASVQIDDRRSRTLQRNHRALARGGRRRAAARSRRAPGHGAEAREPRAGRLGHTLVDASSALAACLEAGLVPVVPGQGSVGASGDLAPLAHMAAALMGLGAFFVGGARVPADVALRDAGLTPLVLGPKEGLALLNGTQISTALALAGLFEAERVFHAALVTGALATDAAKGSDGPFDARIQVLRRHRGQIAVATPCARSWPAAPSAPRT